MKRTLLAVLAMALTVPLRAATTLGTLTLTKVAARIFTPNGDGINDKVRFEFDNPDFLPVSGKIYDLSGAHVADINSTSDSLMLWDGKDSDGRIAAGGIYLYQIEFEGKHATGTVIVAR
jgi:hypothetical protein